MNYLALLRGINVGGNNIIKMADLKTCLEKFGLSAVKTYIQSGNVLFESDSKNRTQLTEQIEKILSKTFNYQSNLVLITIQELEKIIKSAPKDFGQQPDKYRYDVLFLKPPLTSAEAIKQMPINPEVDQITAGPNVLYFSRLISKATQSRLNKIVGTPIYKQLTIRNWNTTTKLLTIAQSKIQTMLK